MNALKALMYSSLVSPLPAVVLSLLGWKRIDKNMKLLTFLLIFCFLIDSVGVYLLNQGIRNIFIGNTYFLVQFAVLNVIFWRETGRLRIIGMLLLVFVIGFIIHTVAIEDFRGPQPMLRLGTGLILITLCFIYFAQLVGNPKEANVTALPMVWVSFAVLLYYGGNFFLFLVDNYLTELFTREGHSNIRHLHRVLNILKNLLFAVAIWKGGIRYSDQAR